MIDPRLPFVSSIAEGDADTVRRLIGTTTIRIRLAPRTVGTFAGQILAFQLATLIARLFDRVELLADEEALTRPGIPIGDGPFLSKLRALLPTLRGVAPMDGDSGAIDVVIGQDGNADGNIFLGSSAWGALVSTAQAQPVADSPSPVGPLAAGTLGASEVFKFVFRGRLRGAVQSSGYSLSLLHYGAVGGEEAALPDRVELDSVLFGCGSVGCGFLQAILCSPQVQGSLVTVDNGCFEAKNSYKYSLVDRATAESEHAKAVCAQRMLRDLAYNRLQPLAFLGTAEAYVASLPHDYRIPLAISAVDTFEARFEIQDTLPHRIVNAGIDGTTVEVSVHGFGDGPCLACIGMESSLESWDARPIGEKLGLRPERVYELIRRNAPLATEDVAEIRSRGTLRGEVLSTVDRFIGQPLLSLWNNHVDYSEARVDGAGTAPARVTTAFVSAFAGVLLLAEVLKTCVPELERYQANNSYRQDLLGVPAGGTFKHEREKRGWCLCHSSYRLALYDEKYAR